MPPFTDEPTIWTPDFYTEWDKIIQHRRDLLTNLSAKIKLSQELPQTVPNRQQVAENLVDRQQANFMPDRDQLYGAARFYDIPNYDKMPLPALNNIVQQRRLQMRQGAEGTSDLDQAGLAAGVGLTGTIQGAIGLAKRLPFIGKAIGDNVAVQTVNQKMSEWNEGLTSDLTEEDRYALGVTNEIGQVGGAMAVGIPVWKVAGTIMSRGLGIAPAAQSMNFISRMGRSGLQGGIMSALLEVGSDAPDSEKLYNIALGAGFGAGAEGLAALGSNLSIFGSRLKRSFSTPFDDIQRPRLGSGEVAADYEVMDYMQPRLPGGPAAPTVVNPEIPASMPGIPGRPAVPALMSPVEVPGPVRPAGPPGSTGLVPEQFRLPAQVPSRPTNPALFDHYSQMANSLEAVNPEVAIQMRRVAGQFGPAESSSFGDMGRSGFYEAPTSGVILPQGEAGQMLTVEAVRRAQTAVGPEAFQARVNTEIARRSVTEPLDLAASTEEVARSIVAESGGVVVEPALPATPKGVGPVRAGEAASNLTKRATIVESPAIVEMARQPRYDDADVAIAATASNPGAVQVIQNVGDMAKTVKQLTQATAEGKLTPTSWRAIDIEVTLPTGDKTVRTDLLISDGLPITNTRAAQYKATGMFSGMRSILPGGIEVDVVTPAKAGGFATVKIRNGNQEAVVPAEDLLPGKTSSVMPEDIGISDAQGMYNSFRNLVQFENSAGAEDAGLPQFNWLDDQTSSMLGDQMVRFLDTNGITNPVARNAISNYFNLRRLEDFQMTASEEVARMRSLNAQLTASQTEGRLRRQLPMTLDSRAGAKGLRWENYPGTAGGTLRNVYTQEHYPMESEEAAMDFVRSYNYEQPELVMDTNVPPEVMELVPGSANAGDMEAPMPSMDEVTEAYTHIADMLDEIPLTGNPYEGLDPDEIAYFQNLSGQAFKDETSVFTSGEVSMVPGGGGFQPPVPPPPGSSSGGQGPSFNSPRLPPPLEPSLASEFSAADQGALVRAQQRAEDNLWVKYFTPYRAFTLEMQQALENAGVKHNRLWEDSYTVRNTQVQARNAAHPFHVEATAISNIFNSMQKRGVATKIAEIGDYNERIAAMQRAGYTEKQMAAQRQMADLFDRLFEWTGLPAGRYIPNYMSHVRSAAGRGVEDPWTEAAQVLPKELQFFATYAREGGINAREMDAGVLMHTYIRAMTNERYMAEPWAKMVTKWDQPGIPEAFKGQVLDWLKIVRYGFSPEWSLSIQGVRSVLNTFKIPVTNHDVAKLWNIGLTGMYRHFLGKPSAAFRDSIQPLMAGTKLGFEPVVQAYTDYIKSPKLRDAMTRRAFEGGWAEHGAIPTANADVFRNEALPEADLARFSPGQLAFREGISKATGAFRDAMPEGLRSGITGTILDPAKAYGKLGEFNRIIAGQAGWQVASDAIRKFRTEGQPIATLMQNAKANVYDRPIRDNFQRLIESGRDADAMNVLAHEAANTQMRFGTAEAAIGARSHDGRLAMSLGNFTTQYIDFMRSGFRNGSVSERVGFGARNAAVASALGMATAYSGWKFTKWMWHTALGFTGSPILDTMADAYDVLRGRGYVTAENIATGIAETVNPYGGWIETINNSANALNAANPTENFFKNLITGEKGFRGDIEEFFRNLAVDPSTGSRTNVPLPINNPLPNGEFPLSVNVVHPNLPVNPGAGAQ